MAVITECRSCGARCGAPLSDPRPLCPACREREMRARGWKPWDELTLEEKVEDLNRRVASGSQGNWRDLFIS